VAVASLAVLTFLPVLRHGWTGYFRLIGQWRSGPLLSEAADPGSDAQESNQGLAAAIYRYGLPAPLPPPEDQAPGWFELTKEQVVSIYVLLATPIGLV
ncbi:MAG: hypothetical protein HY815_27350, partial [Candidatus Riflebacteria bacterium]|nr:hypothetical protein [Candidatus Riflebacteria bacterium]